MDVGKPSPFHLQVIAVDIFSASFFSGKGNIATAFPNRFPPHKKTAVFVAPDALANIANSGVALATMPRPELSVTVFGGAATIFCPPLVDIHAKLQV